jgi:hypothetical protein
LLFRSAIHDAIGKSDSMVFVNPQRPTFERIDTLLQPEASALSIVPLWTNRFYADHTLQSPT